MTVKRKKAPAKVRYEVTVTDAVNSVTVPGKYLTPGTYIIEDAAQAAAFRTFKTGVRVRDLGTDDESQEVRYPDPQRQPQPNKAGSQALSDVYSPFDILQVCPVCGLQYRDIIYHRSISAQCHEVVPTAEEIAELEVKAQRVLDEAAAVKRAAAEARYDNPDGPVAGSEYFANIDDLVDE